MILAYLEETCSYGICFKGTEIAGFLQLFTDADYAGDLNTSRSTTGFLLVMNVGPTAWVSKKQKTVTLSTTESEHVAVCHTKKEIIWQRTLLSDIALKQQDPTVLHCDNKRVVRLTFNPEFHKRTKHIDVQLIFFVINRVLRRSTCNISKQKINLRTFSPSSFKDQEMKSCVTRLVLKNYFKFHIGFFLLVSFKKGCFFINSDLR